MKLNQARPVYFSARHCAFLVALWSVGLLIFQAPAVAAIPVFASGNVAEAFNAPPLQADWSTRDFWQGGENVVITDDVSFDANIQPVGVSLIADPLGMTFALPPEANRAAHYNTQGDFLQTYATFTTATLVLAKLENATGENVTDLAVTYDLGRFLDPGESVNEQVAGHRIYYSTSGVAGSWVSVGTFSSVGAVSFNLPVDSWSSGAPLFVLWADDNAAAMPTTGEAAYTLDNVLFMPTIGDPTDPPVPFFGYRQPNAHHTFTAPESFELATFLGGEVTNQPDGPGGAANDALHVSGGSANVVTEQVDLRGFSSPYSISIDIRTLDESQASDFEINDSLHVTAEYSADGLAFTSVDLTPVLVGGSGSGDPLDSLKLLDSGLNGPYTHFSVDLPDTAQTVRLVISASNNSLSEHFYFDNLQVTAVPEPSSVVMAAVGLCMFLGIARHRRRM